MSQTNDFYRFSLFVTASLLEGKRTRKYVGAAYLREGQKVYTVKLWMFPEQKFYLMPDQANQSRMLILNREIKRNPSVGKGKFFWNTIGSGQVDVRNDVVKLEFDLIDRPIYMSIFPIESQEALPELASIALDAS